MVKLAKNPWLIAGVAGNAASLLAVKQAVKAGAESMADLVPLVDSGSYALVLLWNGTLELIQERRVWACADRVTAIGSGADLALGFMYGAESCNARVARAAQRFVARRRVDCGGGCDVRTFG